MHVNQRECIGKEKNLIQETRQLTGITKSHPTPTSFGGLLAIKTEKQAAMTAWADKTYITCRGSLTETMTELQTRGRTGANNLVVRGM